MLYSCSKRWLKTSICKRPRKPNLGKKYPVSASIFISPGISQCWFPPPQHVYTASLAVSGTANNLKMILQLNTMSLWEQKLSITTNCILCASTEHKNAFDLYLSLIWIKAPNLEFILIWPSANLNSQSQFANHSKNESSIKASPPSSS